MKTVIVIDYGMGNVLSVLRSFTFWHAQALLSCDAKAIENADYLVFPGVGAFAHGMAEIKQRGIVQAIVSFCQKGNPFLGICLGMQMMFSVSEEFGVHAGLDLIPGRVCAIPKTGKDNQAHKIPHIGWNQLTLPKHLNAWENGLLAGIPEKTPVYFVHSFTAEPEHDKHRLADCDYNGRLIAAAVCRENMYGTQFHPEKSGPLGLKMIQNFLSL